ncbi:MAG: carbon monoxide dehydrogenase subunit G [Verrucomicrobia bacterium]|nr:carbon monoxide dehydrogenase subunit G [Verrucomicrobiota bacterium]
MKIQGIHEYKAPPEKVFAALTDPVVLQKCIEGCETMDKTGEDSYDAKLRIGVAGIKGNYTGKVRISEKKPPESFTLQAEGKGAPGWVKGTAKIQITPKGEGSELQCEADGQAGGLIAAVGSRLIEAAGKKMLQDFLRKIEEQHLEVGGEK